MSETTRYFLGLLVLVVGNGGLIWASYRKGFSEGRYREKYCSDCADEIVSHG